MTKKGTSEPLAPVDVDAASAGEATFVTIGPSPLKVLGTTSIATVAGTVLVAVGVVVFGFLVMPWLLLHAVGLIVCGGGARRVFRVCGGRRPALGPAARRDRAGRVRDAGNGRATARAAGGTSTATSP